MFVMLKNMPKGVWVAAVGSVLHEIHGYFYTDRGLVLIGRADQTGQEVRCRCDRLLKQNNLLEGVIVYHNLTRQLDKETINSGEHLPSYPWNEHKTSEILPTQQTLPKSIKCPRKGIWKKKKKTCRVKSCCHSW